MRDFRKFAGIALLVQGALFALLVILMFFKDTHGDPTLVDGFFMFVWRFYFPVGYIIVALTGSAGCAGMVESFCFGVPVGIILYSILIGGIAVLVKRLRGSK